jgi:hypothetical protein
MFQPHHTLRISSSKLGGFSLDIKHLPDKVSGNLIRRQDCLILRLISSYQGKDAQFSEYASKSA